MRYLPNICLYPLSSYIFLLPPTPSFPHRRRHLPYSQTPTRSDYVFHLWLASTVSSIDSCGLTLLSKLDEIDPIFFYLRWSQTPSSPSKGRYSMLMFVRHQGQVGFAIFLGFKGKNREIDLHTNNSVAGLVVEAHPRGVFGTWSNRVISCKREYNSATQWRISNLAIGI